MSATALTGIALLLESTIEFSLIVLIALAAAAVLRKRSAALRHWVLSTAIACAALTPFIGRVMPSWQLPVDAVTRSSATAPPIGNAAVHSDAAARDAAALREEASGPSIGATSARVAAAVWAAGAAMNLAVLLAGMWRLMRVKSRAHPVTDRRWTDLSADISRAYGLRRPVLLLQSDHPSLLVTWGILRPKVILPRAAWEWPEDRARVVLSHELAHVRRGDWLAQIAGEVLRSIYWFNPLAWMLCRQLRHESEHAADDAVLRAGVEGRAYAGHLLDVARAMRRHGEAWWPAPAIVHSSTLERRITAMLNGRLDRTPLTRSARLASVAALFALAVAIASAQGALGRFSGAVVDPMNRTLPNATLVLTNVQTNAKHEVRSDSTGQFEFSELPRGDYALEVKYPGFMALKGKVTIAATNVQQTLNLEVGTLQETITVKGGPPEPPDPERERIRAQPRQPLPPRGNDCNATQHGGNLRPPLKLTDVRPDYPLQLNNANVGGTVKMQAVIAKDGTVKEVHVVEPAHPDLDAAAVKAVRQWRFDSTLLNCMPIEVKMAVTVNFTTS